MAKRRIAGHIGDKAKILRAGDGAKVPVPSGFRLPRGLFLGAQRQSRLIRCREIPLGIACSPVSPLDRLINRETESILIRQDIL